MNFDNFVELSQSANWINQSSMSDPTEKRNLVISFSKDKVALLTTLSHVYNIVNDKSIQSKKGDWKKNTSDSTDVSESVIQVSELENTMEEKFSFLLFFKP